MRETSKVGCRNINYSKEKNETKHIVFSNNTATDARKNIVLNDSVLAKLQICPIWRTIWLTSLAY